MVVDEAAEVPEVGRLRGPPPPRSFDHMRRYSRRAGFFPLRVHQQGLHLLVRNVPPTT